MKLAALVSGGKDSIYAAFIASKKHELACLVSLKSKKEDSYMFHTPNIGLVKLQSKAMDLPLVFVESSGIKEKELDDIKKALKIAIKKYKIQGVVSGALASNYQKDRIDRTCKELKLNSLAPLWHINPKQYLKNLIKDNFKAVITAIAAEGLAKDFLGKEISLSFLDKIKATKIHLAGEGGEYESLVTDCPLFNKKIKIKKAETEMENYCTGKLLIEDAELTEK
ncbi:diphthine--ammonia ligase [Candidatus Woesearchaeota archaeon]|nr:diphthine--ammonia ligase [Candidatus Woesearchaeota archaeon]